MKSINGPRFEYQGKSGGVEKEKYDDVLTLQKGATKGEILFGRTGNKSIWQKLRNALTQKNVARFEDVVDFLKSRGMNSGDAKRAARNIREDDGTFKARHFESLLQGKMLNHSAPVLTENEQELFEYKNSSQSESM